eukprot:gene9512-22211_t
MDEGRSGTVRVMYCSASAAKWPARAAPPLLWVLHNAASKREADNRAAAVGAKR